MKEGVGVGWGDGGRVYSPGPLPSLFIADFVETFLTSDKMISMAGLSLHCINGRRIPALF